MMVCVYAYLRQTRRLRRMIMMMMKELVEWEAVVCDMPNSMNSDYGSDQDVLAADQMVMEVNPLIFEQEMWKVTW